MAKLIFENLGKEVELPNGTNIKDVCEEAGVPMACGEGYCGVCVIEIIEGMDHLSDFTEAEKDFFGEEGKERLACQCQIKEGTVKVKF